jgi:phosphoserine phosphatase RsbU/P
MHTPKTVLVIDDLEPFRRYLQISLELVGYRVVTAAGGRQGVELFEQTSPDIVLVDLQMPDMNGLDVITEISKISNFIPTIVISGQGLLADSIEATRRGAWDYLISRLRWGNLNSSSHAVLNGPGCFGRT